ncbi:uncharacterized protein LOC125235495 isoform X1 [Leguminivora glycinivorella]|uniref:uncharacterized protein LOC125235495 isoform X1 n=1 Tax=Leguminivora glycinivorella TaxID=1035111 RepID=UPI00200E76DF|nr:uncharacterized protein LOC125235495 isoform X1 [Leguminivora glycinivorella]
MEDLLQKLLEAKTLTNALIQEVFISAKKLQSVEQNSESWDKVTQVLWYQLQSGLLKLDDQLLCSTCFYTIIPLTGKEEFYLKGLLQGIDHELNQRENDVIINPKTTWAVSLMYGMSQSNFLTKSRKANTTLELLLNSTIDLLIQMAYDYSRNTFIVFKTISSLKKVCGTQFQDCIFTQNNQVRLLNLVNHNWENPITGVRDLNKTIFQTLISLMDFTTYQNVVKEINTFYWNKAKYLMLAEMIGRCKGNILNLLKETDWLTGLSNSLEKPGLVSAGTDMYFAILKNLASADDWIQMFLPTIDSILNGRNTKPVEHFNNYWCLQTFKKFPALVNQFEVIFENTEELERKLYNSLSIFKQANKLGLVHKNWNSVKHWNLLESMVLQGIEHSNVDIRMAAFDIICEFQGKTIPSQIEFELILNYVKNNINSDCTVLRLGMLKCLKNFLMQNHAAFTTHCKNKEPVDLQDLLQFLISLQELVVSNLIVKGNYQRKITSVKVCSIVWECLIDIPKNKKNQTRHSDTTLYKMLLDDGKWLLSDDAFVKKLISFLQDPSDDIRENVVHLLLNYYSPAFKKTDLLINHVIVEALKSIRGKFFYEISCGQSMFKLIVSILLKEKLDQATFKTVEDVFTFAFNELTNENELHRDILESIENGKQLHSFMDIMLVVLDVCDQKSYNIKISDDEIMRLLKTLDTISNHFAWEENSSSSDFSKMNDMVEQIINKSGHTAKDDKDDTKISGIHQMVLNCIWLNVKACCDLASLMIRHCDQVHHIEKFLLIITRVLESSRHKGAIEAAGAALGQAIQYLTSLPDEVDISRIPHVLLKNKLKELITEASKMASITRRGAGLSIMVHRIVSSDMKKGKPLFHYFMNMILETCSHSEDIPEKLHGNTDIENEKDLPKAIYIHFLTRIVVDSSIASDVMYYSPQLAKLAFDNLTSPHWQIRNAALQLYGALVPKLIGQKKASGTGDETIATVACDEIRTHSPKLWIYINHQLGNISTSDKVLSHSNLVPILNMLANSAMRYNFSSDTTEEMSSHSTLLQSLICLLDSPIYTVRRLTAKSIFNIFSFDVIYEAFMEHGLVSENFMHGMLILLAHCYKHYNDKETQFQLIKQSIQNKLYKGTHSYLCKEMYEDIFKLNVSVDILLDTMTELDANVYAPGVHSWANARVRKCIKNIDWSEMSQVIDIITNRNRFENYCRDLLEKIKCENEEIPKDVLKNIAELLLTCNNKFCSSELWKILYKISQLVEINCFTESLLQAIQTNGHTYKLRYLLPFTVRILLHKNDEKGVVYLSREVLKLCDPESVDVEMRYIAALTNNEFSNAFHRLSDAVKVITIESAIILLQDEDEDVRLLSTIFYKNVTLSKILPHPYICLQKILEPKLLNSVLSDPQRGINMISEDLTALLTKTNNANASDSYNPFANDSKNIYLEVEILQQLVNNLNVSQ